MCVNDTKERREMRDVSVLSFGHPLCVCPSFGRHFIFVGVHIFSAFFFKKEGRRRRKKNKEKNFDCSFLVSLFFILFFT